MTSDAVGGVWVYALELAAHLARHDVEVVLAVMGPAPSADQRREALCIPRLKLYAIDAKLEWMHEPWADLERAGRQLLQIAQDEGVDIAHLNGYTHAALPWRAPVLVVAHSCVCSWWEAVHGCAPPAQWREYRERVSAGVRAADHVVAPSAAYLTEVQRWHGRARAASVIHNARSRARFRARNVSRESVILACGRLWDEAKNMRALDAAARELPWPVQLAGDAQSPDGAQFSGSNLELLGRLTPSQIAQRLQRAAIFVHPARYEPFGLSVLEAALSGCALVINDLPTLRELWDGAAYFVPADRPTALREALQVLIESPQQRAALSQAALARARRYTVRRMGRAYRSLYSTLLARGRAGERAVA